MQFRRATGTLDVLPEDQPYRQHIERAAMESARLFGFDRISTPTFESTALFVRGVGEGTDLIDKEMYSFETKGGDALTLRPEGTAPVMRAFLEHGMQSRSMPVRLYYVVPIYRHDRPGAGRYREHTQFGAECIGIADSSADAEVVALAWEFYRRCGLEGLELQLSNIGDEVCRPAYVTALRAYYASRLDLACATCRERYERNPIRLLDCKVPTCQPIIDGAPKPMDYLCDACKEHFDALQAHLRSLAIPFRLNPRLVRGLGYYTRTVFEVYPPIRGAQSAVGGGGRYDRLIEELGGKPTPAVGFGIGLERIILNLREQGMKVAQEHPTIYVAAVGEPARHHVLPLLQELRSADISAVGVIDQRGLKAQLRQADSLGVTYAAILGDDEIATGTVQLKYLKSGEQQNVARGGPLLDAILAPKVETTRSS